MKWLVQEFLNNASNYIRICNALDECSTEYLIVRINNDFSLTIIDKDLKVPIDNSNEILNSFIKDESIMVYGSKALANISDDMGLNPGSFMNESFEFDVFQKELGDELLNSEIFFGELSTLQPIAEQFFIRPTGNTKLFNGMAVTKKEFLEWKERENNNKSPYVGQTLMISPLQKIKVEYRFFVIKQEVVTGSSYKVGDKVDDSIRPPIEVVKYTKQMVEKFPLAEAFVIDVAETEKGLKVVEYNNINTSGLYGCDEIAFVNAINQLDLKHK